jgi:type II secretion system protein G
MRSLRDSKGFTLIELMIVVVIIGILAALAIPRFTQASARAKEKEADGILKQIYTLQQTYKANAGKYTTSFDTLMTVGWETPTGMKWFQTPTSPTFPVCLAKVSGQSGYNTRQIDSIGTISDGTC